MKFSDLAEIPLHRYHVKMADSKFDECYKRAKYFEDNGLSIPVIHINGLIAAKKIAGRAKDMDDIEHL